MSRASISKFCSGSRCTYSCMSATRSVRDSRSENSHSNLSMDRLCKTAMVNSARTGFVKQPRSTQRGQALQLLCLTLICILGSAGNLHDVIRKFKKKVKYKNIQRKINGKKSAGRGGNLMLYLLDVQSMDFIY